jgi:hypothetical protein
MSSSVESDTQVAEYDWPVTPYKAAMISDAIERYQLRSIIDVGACWGVNGGYAQHALASGKIERAIVLDGCITNLTRARFSNEPRAQLREGDLGNFEFIDAIPRCDAAIIFDVLLHQVDPDWDEFIARYARKVDHFIIYNQDLNASRTVRFHENGLDWYVQNVPGVPEEPDRISQWFAKHDQICPWLNRPWRDVHHYWQWGITKWDLMEKLRELGFTLDWFNNFGIWSDQYPNIKLNGYLFSRARR